MQKLRPGNPNPISVRNLCTPDGLPVSGAVVKAVVKDLATGTQVTGETWPLTLPEITPGFYKGVPNVAMNILNGVFYVVEVTATAAEGEAFWETPALGRTRK